MALDFLDSANGNDFASRWTVTASPSIQGGVSPSGRSAYQLATSNSGIQWSYPTPPASALVAWYFRLSSLDNDGGNNVFMGRLLGPGGTIHLVPTVTTSGALRFRLGASNGTVLVTSDPGVISINTWHHLEIRATVDDSSGRIEAWVDGAQVIDYTGDTRNGGGDTTVGSIFFARVTNGTLQISDIRFGSGTTPLGVTTVWMHLPNGVGNTTGLTPSPGGGEDNYQDVDEATPDGDSTYVHSDVEGTFDLYQLDDLPAGTWDVLAVQATFNVKTDDGGSKFVRPVVRSGGSNATGASQSVPASYLSRWVVFDDNPVTAAAWTASEVDALEVGPEVRDS